ncbi:uncharacterized protein LOC127280955, partial [Leptopilina boulardi]|uniref:uncharacterized protein LOC127280955 n=1 Tax=Leptopilina boulardi TaxID=63433 RepID=UPI0021F51CD6
MSKKKILKAAEKIIIEKYTSLEEVVITSELYSQISKEAKVQSTADMQRVVRYAVECKEEFRQNLTLLFQTKKKERSIANEDGATSKTDSGNVKKDIKNNTGPGMSFRVVRSSKFRHVYGTALKREQC